MSAHTTQPARRPIRFSRSTVITASSIIALAATAWITILLSDPTSVTDLFTVRNFSRLFDFLSALTGGETAMSPQGTRERFSEIGQWNLLGKLAVDTLVMSVLAIWIAIFGMLATVMFGARPRGSDGAVGPVRRTAYLTIRGAWIFARAIPELVWALILVVFMPPGILVGALALGIHNFGIVSKLCSEVVEDLDPRPGRALRASGASQSQTLLYGVLPQALPQFLTYSLYRWEVIIRTTIIVGFVAAGGLGREFRLAMSFFHYSDIAMILITYFVLVISVDLASAGLRRLAR